MTAATAPNTSRPMTTPAQLRIFREQFEIARASRATALSYLDFEDQHATSGAGMKRTWKAALECGTALKNMHDSGSWQDNYDSWAALCRELRIQRSKSYRLMSCAEILAGVPKSSIGNIQTPLSGAKLKLCDDAADEQADTDVNDDAETGDAAPPKFAKLRETLGQMSRDKPAEPEIDPEAEKKPRAENGPAWVQHKTAALRSWFVSHGLGQAAGPHLAALEKLAAAAEVAGTDG